MRYYLDTEFNGFGGDLLSLALVPEDGDQDYYVVIPFEGAWHPWVEKHVMPYLDSVPPMLLNKLDRIAAAHDIAAYLAGDPDPVIIADWPEDIALFCRLLLVAETEIVDIRHMRLEFHRTPGFSTARNSKVPHNALHDARALRDHLVALD
ncbi:hypothetical protein [Rhizorhabdus dicambivorans]|uniref:Uncharacterized protein n=1 Tax=Rhizorhabdus dicambivorans TaxID=1850238 RepID=A0A2A4FYN2_9SPHN|nr:hypothetical protein [Rhizorhabdus dicambivorans]ATE63721.1 hypothetical protein CMV14_04345 [Rhizorhabdus dicambivorans]PCE42851.1 hypothetical protein COO09_08480 [Rhizorhabdus dicambivorans]